MAADLAVVAQAFVAVLTSNSIAREAFQSATHPVDPVKTATIINDFADVETKIEVSDVGAILPLITEAMKKLRAEGNSIITSSIMPGDFGPHRASIMAADKDPEAEK